MSMTLEDLDRLAQELDVIHHRCKTIEEATKILQSCTAKPRDIISIEQTDRSYFMYGHVFGPDSSEDAKIEHHVVIIPKDSSVNIKDLVDKLSEFQVEVPEPISLLDNVEKFADMMRVENFLPELPEPKRDPHWYNQYDRRGKKKHRKYQY